LAVELLEAEEQSVNSVLQEMIVAKDVIAENDVIISLHFTIQRAVRLDF